MNDTSSALIAFELAERVGTIRFCRPEKMNAFTASMHARLRAVLEECAALAGSGQLRALVLTGEGRAFCTGQDLNERRRAPGDPPPDLGASVRENYNTVIQRLTQLPVPVIAAVNGPAAGAGFGLALACDLLVAARSASFVASFSRIGLVADSGVGWFLQRLVGANRARAMIMLAEPVSADEALRLGIATRVVEDAELQASVAGLARQLASGPTRAYALEKRSLAGGWDRTLAEQLESEAQSQYTAGRTADYREGVDAFLSRRKAAFTGT
jgi:2-(1,2-epoxy-1,2-dihydrophenyl)acetyl-CoA isomerase